MVFNGDNTKLMNPKQNVPFKAPFISNQLLVPIFILIFTVFIGWSTFQQSALFEKKLYHRVLATVAQTGINANAIEIDGRDVIIGLAYIQSPLQLNQINQLLVNLPGVANVYNKKASYTKKPTPAPSTPSNSTTIAQTTATPIATTATDTTQAKPVTNTEEKSTAPITETVATPEKAKPEPEPEPIDLAALLSEKIAEQGIEFDFRTDVLTAASRKKLDELVPLFQENQQQKIQIGSHTDNQGDAKLNQHLSQKRADSVVNYLVKKGVQRDQLSAKGYGEMQPIATNKTETGRKQNRRITFSAGK